MSCRIWSQPDADHWRPLCTNIYKAENPVSGQGCDLCVQPKQLLPPTQCYGCGPAEKFPVVWDFTQPFTVAYPGSETVTTSNATTYPILNDVPPGASAPATATVVKEMPAVVQSKPLIAVLTPDGAGGMKYGCAWGNGNWRASGFLFRPTYGTPSPPPGGCSLLPGFYEERVVYGGSGPLIRANGTSSVGNQFDGCYQDLAGYYYANMPETIWGDGSPPYPGFGTSMAFGAPGDVDRGGCSWPSIFYEVIPQYACWNWFLGAGAPANQMKLWLNISGFRYLTVSPVIFVDGYYRQANVTDGSLVSHVASMDVLFSSLSNAQTLGGANWTGTYPCNNSDTVTLTLNSGERSGCLGAGVSTLPSTVTLRKVRGS